jgi:dolichol-phosphate mannosyltransferase
MTGMTGETPRVSVVVPAYDEGERIVPVLDRIFDSVRLPCEVLVVVDTPDDTTIGVIDEYARKEPRLRCLINSYGRGPANAIRYGIDAAAAPVAVVTMADGCDDPRQIDGLARLVDRGVAVAAASRYMPGGQQVASGARARGHAGRHQLV